MTDKRPQYPISQTTKNSTLKNLLIGNWRIGKYWLVALVLIVAQVLFVGQSFSQEGVKTASEGQEERGVNAGISRTFTDGDFASGWTDVSVVGDDPNVSGTGPGTSTFDGSTVRSSGGNPGAYREIVHTIQYGDRIFSGGLNSNAVYDPSVSGAINEIDFSSDFIRQSAAGGASGWTILIKQNGNLYFVERLAITNSSWKSFTSSSLTEEDFTEALPGIIPNNNHPDFSSSGSPITFGYVFTNGLTGPGTLALTHKVDNWSVTVNPNRVFLPVLMR